MSAGKLSTDCDRVICSPFKTQTLLYSQAVESYGPDMARALDVCQEDYTVRICAKSNTVEKHDHHRSLLLMCVHCHITTTFAWVQTCFLFVLMPPNVVSWLLFVLMCCRHMSPYLWLGVPSSMSYWTWAVAVLIIGLGLAYLVNEMLSWECCCLHYSQSLWTVAFFWDSISPVRYQMGSCNSSSPSI